MLFSAGDVGWGGVGLRLLLFWVLLVAMILSIDVSGKDVVSVQLRRDRNHQFVRI